MNITSKDAERGNYEVGLIQNLLSSSELYEYGNGSTVTVRNSCSPPLPLRDGVPPLPDGSPSPDADPVFMAKRPGELEDFPQNGHVGLHLTDQPTYATILDLAANPVCPGVHTGTLKRATINETFRTWVAVRVKADASCMTQLHHIDWETNVVATVGPDVIIMGNFKVTEPDGDGSPKPVLGGDVAGTACTVDLPGACK